MPTARHPRRALRQALPLALVAGFALLLAAAPAAAQYKWRDAHGQIHISDLPPPRDVPDKDVLQRPAQRRPLALNAQAAPAPAAVPSAAASGRPPVDPELETRRQRAEQEARVKAQADEERAAAQRAENCQRARQQLALIDSGQRMQRINAQGERVVLDDATRAAEAQIARRVIDSDCR